MRILFIRHGDPDYDKDSLTEKGWREAALLAEYAPCLGIDDCYQSPLGRAQDTARGALQKLGKQAPTLDWLQEFYACVDLNKSEELAEAYPNAKKDEDGTYSPRYCVWDMAPAYYFRHPEYMDRLDWRESELAACSDVVSYYDRVCEELDKLLAGYGYMRDGLGYRVEKESTETVALFCHFGVICAMLSHLMNVSPFALLQGTVLAPTSVTEVVTEERQQGIASFRAMKIGDISHLSVGNEPAAFAARFCEVYSNIEQRH